MKKSVYKYGALLVIFGLTLFILVKSLFCETYEDVIKLSPGRNCPPVGYQRGQCPDPNTYDWTKGECTMVDEGPVEWRLRWNGNLKINACIPNDWEPESAHRLQEVMKSNQHYQ